MAEILKLTNVICMSLWCILLWVLLHDYSLAKRLEIDFPKSLQFLIGCTIFEIITKFMQTISVG